MNELVFPWFVAVFVFGSTILGVNALNDWLKKESYPVFDVVAYVLLLLVSFIFSSWIPFIILSSIIFVAMNIVAGRGFIGTGDPFVMTWTTLAFMLFHGLFGVVIFLLMIWIGVLSLVVVNRYFRPVFEGDKIPFFVPVFVSWTLSNLLLYIVLP